MSITVILAIVQVAFAVIIGLYFLNLLRAQQGSKTAVIRESSKEVERLRTMRAVSLGLPLSERTRPSSFDDIVGQDEGLRMLRAALCGPHPQHIIIYGPPGVGKTAAARLVLEEAKENPLSPFSSQASFVEVDACTARFDERGIADPLIGSVHDPIYQGAGPMGIAGIPQPKPGAVTEAHGGVLFLDEIGELHPVQMNKLLKVLEDRMVFLKSAYYNRDDPNVPQHIRDIFDNGLPADFRLVGATTRQPHEIPAAIRSRCLEVFMRELSPDEVVTIACNAAIKMKYTLTTEARDVIARYAANGRDAVNIVQLVAGLAATEGRHRGDLTARDVEWVINRGQYNPRLSARVPAANHPGLVCGLAVTGPGTGLLIEVEAVARPSSAPGSGRLTVTGVIEEEEMGAAGHRLRKKSMARDAVENVLTAVQAHLDHDVRDFDLHINFPGGVPVDGPSAGLAMACAVYSALTGTTVDRETAMTGEVTARGSVKPVGGIIPKVEAACRAGIRRVLLPGSNFQEWMREHPSLEISPISLLGEALDICLPTPGDISRRG